jgi:hypothetical protein
MYAGKLLLHHQDTWPATVGTPGLFPGPGHPSTVILKKIQAYMTHPGFRSTSRLQTSALRTAVGRLGW